MALTPVSELQTLIEQKITKANKQPEIERLPIVAALGRVLAEDVASIIAIPNADVSAMDGYALPQEAAEGSVWRVVGESVAGRAYVGDVPADGCVRIMTGAVVPADCVCVVLQENVSRDGDTITLQQAAKKASNIRFAGEEVKEGEVVLQAGRVLRDADVMLLASVGWAQVSVYRKILVAVLSTGDELDEPGTVGGGKERIFDSNRYALMARLAALPVEILDLGQVGDDLENVLHKLDEMAQQVDVVITSGGVSVGDYDFMREAVERLGAIHHYKVAMKPGKPFVFGRLFDTWYFGLPGNPVSGFVGFDIFLKSALWQLCGASPVPEVLRISAKLAEPVRKRAGRMDFQRARIWQDEGGQWLVAPEGAQDSHRVWGVSRANAYLVLPTEANDLAAGDEVCVQPFFEAFL